MYNTAVRQAPPAVFCGSAPAPQYPNSQQPLGVAIFVTVGQPHYPTQYPQYGQPQYGTQYPQPYPQYGQPQYGTQYLQPYPQYGQPQYGTQYPPPYPQYGQPQGGLPGIPGWIAELLQQPSIYQESQADTEYSEVQAQQYAGPSQQPQMHPAKQKMLMFMAWMMGYIAGKKSKDTKDTVDSTPTTDIDKSSRGEWGDPHYHLIGANGKEINFDHKGIDNHTYNIFEGDNLKIDGKYVKADDPENPQVVGIANVNIGEDNLRFDKKGNASLNGETLEKGSTKTLADGTKIEFDKDGQIIITTADCDSQVHMRAEENGITIDPSGTFTNAGGIIGTAISENRELSKKECDKFDVTDDENRKIN